MLGEALAREVTTVLNDHFRGTLHVAAGGIDFETMDVTAGWQARSRRRYQAAAQVAARIGIDVDRTALGQDMLSLMGYGEKTVLAGAKVSVPALGKTRLALRLRNWTDRPRAWRVASAAAWIVPEKSKGVLIGQQPLGILLDGRDLQAGEEVSGTVTVSDVAAGTSYPITVAARVEKAIELRVCQEIDFITGGGSGAEAAKAIHIETEPVFNVPLGGSQTREYSLVSRAAEKQAWKIAGDCDWLVVQPASGEIAPGSSIILRITARPRDAAGAFRESLLTLTAAGGTVREQYRLTTYVIPPYQAPAAPAGAAVYLNELDQKQFLKSHVDAGFGPRSSDDKRRPRPWMFADPPVPYYHPFNRAADSPEGTKRDAWQTWPSRWP